MWIIRSLVAAYYDLSPEDLESKNEDSKLEKPRQVAAYLCHKLTKCSIRKIGQSLSNRSKTWVIKAIKQIKEECESDRFFDGKLSAIERLAREYRL